jgi:hypothetical protein
LLNSFEVNWKHIGREFTDASYEHHEFAYSLFKQMIAIGFTAYSYHGKGQNDKNQP